MTKTFKPDGTKRKGGGHPSKDPAEIKQQLRTRNLTRSAAEITRQHGAPLEIICEFQNAVLAGHSSATIQQDDDGDWYVTWEEGELASTVDQKFYAANFLTQRGYGMPAQTVHVEQEMRVTVQSTSIALDKLPAAALAALASMRQALLPAARPPAPEEALPASTIDDPDIEDAELVESTSTNDQQDPLATETEIEEQPE